MKRTNPFHKPTWSVSLLIFCVILLAGCAPDRSEVLDSREIQNIHKLALVSFMVEPDVYILTSEGSKPTGLPQLALDAADSYVVYFHNRLDEDSRFDFKSLPELQLIPDYATLLQESSQKIIMGGPVTSRSDLPYINSGDEATLVSLPKSLGVDAVFWIKVEYLLSVEDRLGETNRWRGTVTTNAILFDSSGKVWEAYFRTPSVTTAQGTPMDGFDGFLGGETLPGTEGYSLLNDASESAATRLIEGLALALSGKTPEIWGPHWLAPFRPYITLLVFVVAVVIGLVSLSERESRWLIGIAIVLIVGWVWLQFFAGWGFSLREWFTSLLTPTIGMTWWVRTMIIFGLPGLTSLLFYFLDDKLEYSISPKLRTFLAIIFGVLVLAGIVASLYLLIFQGWWRFVLRTLLTGEGD